MIDSVRQAGMPKSCTKMGTRSWGQVVWSEFNEFIQKPGFITSQNLSPCEHEVLASVKELIDCGINLYIQKEQFNLLGDDGKPSMFAPVMLATLSTCAQLERDNITFRLQSGRKQYIAKGGKLGRKPGSTKSADQKREKNIRKPFPFWRRAMPSGMWQSWQEKASALFSE